ncbi:ABC transporter permease [Novosphingobium flavum]|uniref:ABC transporter permease n=1 Tax=Novosphingobium flavum TaxID=1778672 RepID=A0A7X1KMP8_9SPHN|nr:ABC transporter permease [Novosphingobium flavum]MBC2666866.1 ABC transporter permease [Novosphingobium flavum]
MRLVNIKPARGPRFLIGAVPIIILLVLYAVLSAARAEANAHDKVLPTFLAMGQAALRLFTEVDPRTGDITALADTSASLWRLAMGVGIATLSTLLIGIALGVVPLVRAALGPLVTVIAVIPPIAVLPILFIALGLGEASKIALIAVGIAPYMIRDLASHVAGLPAEQFVKAQTLGASTWQLTLRVALPQALPRLIDSLRFSMGPAWVFLISAEAIASDVGLGYRIFLVRRYLSMDIILPYVAWISCLAILTDWALLTISRKAFPWAHGKGH